MIEGFSVLPIDADQYKEFLLKIHYAKRLPAVVLYSYGLFDENLVLVACITFGLMATRSVEKVFSPFKLYELSRLVALPNLPKNSLSYFVARSINKLPSPCVLVSYADTKMNHHGYIYQATNWVYTGLTEIHYDYVESEHKHPRTSSRGVVKKEPDGGFLKLERSQKHRYFYFVGSKSQKRKMLDLLPYKICGYPKGDNSNYQITHKPSQQTILF
jgi:hypothetical protein